METEETKQKLANAIKDLEAKGDTATINVLVSAYKQKYRTPQTTQSVSDSLWTKMGQAKGFGEKFDTLLQSGANATKNIPGAKLGKAVGESIYGLGTAGKKALTGDFSGASQTIRDVEKGQNKEEITGDIIKAISLPASFAVNPVSAIGKIGAGAGLGAIASTGEAMSKSESPLEVAKKAVYGGLVGGAVSGAFVGLGKLLEKTGEKITQGVIKPSQHDIEDGFKIETVKKYKLGGSLSKMYDKTDDKLSELSTQLNRKLASSNETIDLNEALQNTADTLKKGKMKGFGTNTQLDKTIEQIKEEILAISQDGKISIPDAQLVKQASGKYGAWQYGMNDPESTARQTVFNAFYKTLKESIEKNSPEGVKEINKQISEIIPVAHALTKRIPVAERNRGLSFQDMMTLVASTIDPRALAMFGISRAQKSGTIGNALMQSAPSLERVAPIAGGIGGDISSQI